MTVAFTNQASTTLAGGISAAATSLALATTTGANFPTTAGNQWFYLTLTNKLQNWTKYEIVKVTTRAGDTCSVIVRAQDGTTAQAWDSGDFVQLRLTKGTFGDLTVQYANNADNLSNLASAATSRTNLGLGTMATQNATAVAITGGTIAGATLTTSAFNGTVGATTPSTGAFTTTTASGQMTSTLATGTAPLVIASTTVVGNLNVSQLLGFTWNAPGAIGSVTPSSGAFTTLAASGAVSGAGFTNYLASPPAIGGSTPSTGNFTAILGTTIRATTYINYRGGDNASSTNSGFGESALDSNSGGTSNTAVGNNALTANTSGSENTAGGYGSLSNTTTGNSNTAFGAYTIENNRIGVSNSAFGDFALRQIGLSTTAGQFVIGVDYVILTSGSTNFSAVGAANNNPGTQFTASGVGSGTGTASPLCQYNTAAGSDALGGLIAGNNNSAFGRNAAAVSIVASNLSAFGLGSLQSNFGAGNNSAFGTLALELVGPNVSAGSFVNGVSYTIYAVGTTDFTLIGAVNNNYGTVFTATGPGLGSGSAYANATGNSGFGYRAGNSLTTGTNCTLLGTDSDVTSVNQTNSTAIGYQATATADNQVVLGNASVTEYKLPGTTAHVKYAGSYSSGAPVTETSATHSVAVSTSSLICNRAGTITVTLPSAATYSGRELRVKTITANTVVSASSNVVPLIGGAAGTAICAGVAGSWALLHSDGSNWIIMAGA